jgi:hypothetical protein
MQHVSLLVVCGCGVWRQWSPANVKVMQVRADGPVVAKDEC